MIDNIIVGVFNAAMTVAVCNLFFASFASPRNFKFRRLVMFILTAVFALLLVLQVGKGLNFVLLLSVIAVLSFLYKTKWINRIFLSVAFVLLSSLAELIVAISSGFILSVELDTLKTGMYYVSGILLSKLLSLIMVVFLRAGKHSLPLTRVKGIWLYIGLLPLASVIMIFVISDYMYMIQEQLVMQTIALVGMCLLIASNILVFYVLDKMCENFETKQRLALIDELLGAQKRRYSELYESQQEVIKVRHDLKNVMLGLSYRLEREEYAEALEYVQKQCTLLDGHNNTMVFNNNIIDTILFAKQKRAMLTGIQMVIDNELHTDIRIDPIDIAVIIGNVLDNAIEAVEKSGFAERKIQVDIMSQREVIVFLIRNPVEEKIDVNNLVSTKSNKREHGLGLAQVSEIIKRYNGELLLDCDAQTFSTTIVLNNTNDE